MSSPEGNYAEKSGKLKMQKGFGHQLITGNFEKTALVKQKNEISWQEVQNMSTVRLRSKQIQVSL